MKINVPIARTKSMKKSLIHHTSGVAPNLLLVASPSKLVMALLLAMPLLITSQKVHAEDDPLLSLSLEELVEFRITSMARKTQNITDVSAAAHVITADEIRRSGATTIAEALQLVPGINVARLSRDRYAISSRGFNERFSNKLLVLMDGRSIYSPLFSGVMWENQDTVLEDIEQIEVVRGPGAALWGTNAMNGVINIVTRKAKNTQGNFISVAAGTGQYGMTTLRHGGELDDGGFYRFYAKTDTMGDSYESLTGKKGIDGAKHQLMGFRLEKNLEHGNLTVLSEIFDTSSGDSWRVPVLRGYGDSNTPYSATRDMDTFDKGWHLQARYDWKTQAGSEASLQAYIDNANALHKVLWGTGIDNTQPYLTTLGGRKTDYDLDFQIRQIYGKNDVIWGLGVRYTTDELLLPASPYQITEGKDKRFTFSAFVNDDYTLVPEKLKLILGSKFEKDGLTGFNYQPNFRILWTPASTDTVWGALSKSVRALRRTESDSIIDVFAQDAADYNYRSPVPLPAGAVTAMTRLEPPPGTKPKPEEAISLEGGWRKQINSTLQFESAAFYNEYKGLRAYHVYDQQPNQTASILQCLLSGRTNCSMIIAGYTDSSENAKSWGGEILLNWQAKPWWRIQTSYSYLKLKPQYTGDIFSDRQLQMLEQSTQTHQALVSSSMNLSNGVTFDASARYTSATSHGQIDGSVYKVPAYTALDARLAWQKNKNLEFAIVGKNLLKSRHTEFFNVVPNSVPYDVSRSVFVTALWRF